MDPMRRNRVPGPLRRSQMPLTMRSHRMPGPRCRSRMSLTGRRNQMPGPLGRNRMPGLGRNRMRGWAEADVAEGRETRCGVGRNRCGRAEADAGAGQKRMRAAGQKRMR
ncbi:hypothetical protein JOB18_011683 [Solea senegalensis]|nr:hypothetical protein JOB18_011683 [Solea senegalensis]